MAKVRGGIITAPQILKEVPNGNVPYVRRNIGFGIVYA